jgi:diphthamide synthase (EF-2-diphthine--ammonia ligase)
MDVVEPLDGMSSRECVDAFVDSGHQAVTVVVDARVLDPSHVGASLTRDFVECLPPGVDPCGELGEYHSFVHDGPLFSSPINFTLSPVRLLKRSIGTTQGIRDFAYWESTFRRFQNLPCAKRAFCDP